MEENTFTVMPMSRQINLQPGETYTGELTIINPADSASEIKYKLEVSPYNVVGTDNTADLATVNNRNEIIKWVKFDEPTGTVKPNESRKVTFTIDVPENAPSGGQYAAIAVQDISNNQQQGGLAVNNIFELASVIYAQVGGETVRDIKVLENNVPSFVLTTPIETSALIQNDGNIHENATFMINVTNFMTGETIYPTDDKEGEFNEIIMPESSRLITRDIGNMPALGVVKVNQTIYFNGDVSTVEKDVIICPLWFMLLVVITIGAIVTFIVSRVKKHRKNKAHAA